MHLQQVQYTKERGQSVKTAGVFESVLEERVLVKEHPTSDNGYFRVANPQTLSYFTAFMAWTFPSTTMEGPIVVCRASKFAIIVVYILPISHVSRMLCTSSLVSLLYSRPFLLYLIQPLAQTTFSLQELLILCAFPPLQSFGLYPF